MRIELTFNCDPMPWQRAGYNRKQSRFYTKGKTASFENLINDLARLQYEDAPVEDIPLKLEVTFYLKKLKAVKRRFPYVKPDIDNLLKSLLDGLQGVIFKNDSQIVDIISRKRYAQEGKILVTITRVK